MPSKIVPVVIGLPVALIAGAAHAAPPVFPADTAYHPMHCHGAVMTDPLADQPPALAERDVVGDLTAPAGLRAGDADNLYLRLRVDQDPAPGGAVHPYAWGMEFDLDGDRSTYELLVVAEAVSAAAGTVSVFTNHTTTIANDPADPADLPAAATIAFTNAARTIGAGTTTGSNADFFIDIAVPWATLRPFGLDRGTPTYIWAGTSTVANALDGDLACFDGQGGNGRPPLDSSASDPTTGDPTMDPNGDGGGSGSGTGTGGTGDDEPRLEGGSGCQSGRGGVGLGLGATLGLLPVLGRRRRRLQ
ncbi:MAG TPA: hypothetical protein VH165_12810 [Kofleriaceae bacterium]|nr:hypothetical protein [Kofleriaceae bacterium]